MHIILKNNSNPLLQSGNKIRHMLELKFYFLAHGQAYLFEVFFLLEGKVPQSTLN